MADKIENGNIKQAVASCLLFLCPKGGLQNGKYKDCQETGRNYG